MCTYLTFFIQPTLYIVKVDDGAVELTLISNFGWVSTTVARPAPDCHRGYCLLHNLEDSVSSVVDVLTHSRPKCRGVIMLSTMLILQMLSNSLHVDRYLPEQ